eukprot:sb/3469170/
MIRQPKRTLPLQDADTQPPEKRLSPSDGATTTDPITSPNDSLSCDVSSLHGTLPSTNVVPDTSSTSNIVPDAMRDNYDTDLPHTAHTDPSRPGRGYEYCDHTADIQVHSWGSDLREAFEECCIGMFGIMTDLSKVEATDTFELEARGDDLESLLFHFLDEWLYAFSVEPFFIPNEINIEEFDEGAAGGGWRIRCEGYGEPFSLDKHPQGTEVKAITYSAMQIVKHERGYDLYVIVDI